MIRILSAVPPRSWLCAAFAASPRQPGACRGRAQALQAIDVQPLPGQQLQLTLHLSGPAPQPLSFTIDNPARISLDLPNTGWRCRRGASTCAPAGSTPIVAAEAKDRTRLVLNLDKLVPYDTRVDGNNIVVMLGAGHGARRPAPGGRRRGAARAGRRPAAPREHPQHRLPPRRRWRRPRGRASSPIRIRRSTCARSATRSSSTSPTPTLPANLMRRYDATDFGTPVTGFDVTRVGNGARIVINATGDFEQLAYQSDDQYVVEVQPQRKARGRGRRRSRVYTGERLTLNFQDIETRAVLQLLADASGQNIVVSDSVSGNVTLRLQNVPWDQALDIVLRTKGLDKRQQDNVIIVAPAGGARGAREGGAGRAEGHAGARAAALRVPAGQLRQGRDMAALIKSQSRLAAVAARQRRRR